MGAETGHDLSERRTSGASHIDGRLANNLLPRRAVTARFGRPPAQPRPLAPAADAFRSR